MTQFNQEEIIPMIKPDLKALKKLRKQYPKQLTDKGYREQRISILDHGERVEINSSDYNKIISELIDMLDDDFAEGIFSEEEYNDERETLETLIFKSTKPVDGVEGYTHEEIQYDPKNILSSNHVSNPENMVRVLNKKGISYLMRKTGESTEIISGRRKFLYTHSTNFPARKLFLFIHVRRDVEKWLLKRDDFDIPPQHDVSVYNPDYVSSGKNDICGTDLDHAYWRIAFREGMISEATYNHGLDPECKALRLATISILGREKSYKEYKNGNPVRRIILQKSNPRKQAIFRLIRFTCFNYMQSLQQMLGEDFHCYETDAIYYRNTPENVRMVHDYFNKRNLPFKHLNY